jgi:hypothetical protein
MWNKLKEALSGLTEELGIELPVDLAPVSDAVGQATGGITESLGGAQEAAAGAAAPLGEALGSATGAAAGAADALGTATGDVVGSASEALSALPGTDVLTGGRPPG